MFNLTEIKILELLLNDLTKQYTINQIANLLKKPYAQIHRSIKNLIKNQILSKKEFGRAIVVSLIFNQNSQKFITIEEYKTDKMIKKYSALELIRTDLVNIFPVQFICILFGSYAKNKATHNSDIDLLFIIPDDYDFTAFEKKIKNILTNFKLDITIITEKGLIEMWQKNEQLNVANEILKEHIFLRGIESFFILRRKLYV